MRLPLTDEEHDRLCALQAARWDWSEEDRYELDQAVHLASVEADFYELIVYPARVSWWYTEAELELRGREIVPVLRRGCKISQAAIEAALGGLPERTLLVVWESGDGVTAVPAAAGGWRARF